MQNSDVILNNRNLDNRKTRPFAMRDSDRMRVVVVVVVVVVVLILVSSLISYGRVYLCIQFL